MRKITAEAGEGLVGVPKHWAEFILLPQECSRLRKKVWKRRSPACL
jgi:hypothetical protein